MHRLWSGICGIVLLFTQVASFAQQPGLPPVIPQEPPDGATFAPPPDSLIESPPPLTPPPPPPVCWSGELDLGVNGTEGNSQNFKVRGGGETTRKTEESIWTSSFLYNFADANSQRVENRLLAKTKHEWVSPGSPWSVFGSLTGEYDEFKAYDVRASAHGGVSYLFIKTDITSFKGRVGAGASREFGGPNDDYMPEAVFGFDFEQKLSKRQKFVVVFDYFPQWDKFSNYRFEGKAAWECLIDPEWNLSLRLGLNDRYDSTPEGAKRNDLEYFATLLWKY